ncbi:sugar-binding transcriptional regulator [Ktedonobacter robiniae]|uniref:Transcriptional regulator n=1 Tax=Ktedonobacter robiniae TaxID=2778365 RepID=A0ABQ3UYR6_9CHLR|nr:sugar-binding transcriptional regulator [Ktedonobacter robiniae]GHO58026.1 transcriptional regulator [Ktedonobacter robiniae]
MTDLQNERVRLLVKISRLYYEDGLNQQDIAKRLGISRPHVSRMLTAARAEGIVNISINNPYSREQNIEQELIETFGILDAFVVSTEEHSEQRLLHQLGRSCAVLLESMLKDNDIVGVMAGRTVTAVAAELEYFARNGLQFTPLVGGWGSTGSSWHANSNTMMFAERMKSNYWLLHAPAVVVSQETKELLVKEPEIANVLEVARKSTVAVVGIGQVSKEATIVQTGYFGNADLNDVLRQGAVANVCASFLNIQGENIAFSAKTRMLGIDISELRPHTHVIGVAGSQDKVKAITATLRGKWIDTLVTDLETAQRVLDFHKHNK